jgi:hypothetical protein
MATVNYSGSLRYDMHGRKRKQSRTSIRKVKSVEVSGIHNIPDYDTHRSNKGAYQVVSNSDIKHIGK